MREQETEWDAYQNRVRLWRQLCATVHQIWQDAANLPLDDAEQAWWALYEQEAASLKADENPAYDAWLEKYVQKNGLNWSEAYYRALYIEDWKKKNKPQGRCAEILKWEKQYFQLLNCEGEWIGKRAACCGDETQPIAIPIGCNHRLCPLCNGHRSERARRRTKQFFDRLIHPQFLTLTTPNLRGISKRSFHFFRKRVRQFLAQHKEMFLGGIYAIETTFNRTEKTWHVHAHVLVDASFKLPAASERVHFAGRNMRAFDVIKLALEYDWLLLWRSSRVKDKTTGKMKTAAWDYGAPVRKNARKNVIEAARLDFEWWVSEGFRNALKERRGGHVVPITGLSAEEFARRRQWNIKNRRVIWIKPVDDRERAAREVLKYITKSADFCDMAECVKAFYDATKGARMLQTFGSWYGVNFETDFDTRHMDDWHQPQCACGVNAWERMGTFRFRDVYMAEDGRWLLRRPFDHNSAGTVPRPTIRALDVREEHGSYGARTVSESNGRRWESR